MKKQVHLYIDEELKNEIDNFCIEYEISLKDLTIQAYKLFLDTQTNLADSDQTNIDNLIDN